MNKFKIWWRLHKPTKRRIIQIYAALLFNCNVQGYINGSIFTGRTKAVCVPGINCYSCPGAIGACPLGSLQASLSAANKSSFFYVMGILMLYGVILGRKICGYLCPFGLIQELLYKIKTWKLKKSKATRVASYMKFLIMFVFVVMITLAFAGVNVAVPAFCKYICPAGTLEGGFGLILHEANGELRSSLTSLFAYKMTLVFVFITASIFIFRPFCRFICPLGAFYGFFSPFALFGITVNESKCTHCGLCVNKCKVDIHHVGDHECIQCGECIPVCPTKAIQWKGQKFLLAPNEVPSASDISINSPIPDAPKEEVAIQNETTAQSEAPKKEKKAKEKIPFKKNIKLRRRMHNIGCSTVAVLALATTVVIVGLPDIKRRDVKPGEKCPEISCSYVKKEGSFNIADKKGTPCVINFWGDWCGGCCEEMHLFEEAKQKYQDKVYIVAISDNSTKHPDEFIEDTWPTYTIDFAKDASGNAFYYATGGDDGWPRTLLVDKDGYIRDTYKTFASFEEICEFIDPILK